MPWAWGLIVFEDKIYWTSFTNNTIYRVDKENGSHVEVVKRYLRNPRGIKIYSQENQPTGILCVCACGVGVGMKYIQMALHKDKMQQLSRWRFI